ncbi:MAG: hypothetical protein KDK36_17445 [Leptospiraceae bacterium]|nr:hypothetical protein [Leptospiraceae bacterium]
MKKTGLIIALLVVFSGQIFAERVIGTPGIISEFSKVEELVKNKRITKEYRKQTLEKNLLTAVKFTLLKKYADYDEKIKDLTSENIKFEQQKGTFNYYIQYKDYFLFYNFAVDPELYSQLPTDDRIYIKTKEVEEQEKEAAEGTTGSGSKAPASSEKPADSGAKENKPLMDGEKPKP